MNAVVVDAPTRDRLLGAGGEVEVKDETGAVIGRFTKYTRIAGQLVVDDIPSDEELDRRVREGPWHSTEEVMERLRKLKEALG